MTIDFNLCFFFQAEDGIRDFHVTGVQTCALPIFGVEARTLAPQWVDYYDQRGQVVKRLALSDYLEVGSKRIPLVMVVEDKVRQGYRTVARLSDVAFGIAIPDSCFTLQALERGCR